MSFLNRFVWMFTSPSKVFDDIRERRVGWFQPFVMVSILNMIVAYVSMPVQKVLLELNPGDLPAEQIDKQIEMMDKFGFMWVVMAPAMVLLVALLVSGLSYIMVTVLSQRASFKQYFTLSLFTDIIGMLGQLVSIAVVRLRGLDSIADPEDARVSLGLRMLAPADNAVLKGVLGSVEFFTVWSFVLLAMGLVRIFGMSRGQAIAVLIPIWILYVGLLIAGEVFGGMG